MKSILKSKTFWTGVATIAVSVAGVCTGQIPADAAFQSISGALLAIFIRDGVRKAGK